MDRKLAAQLGPNILEGLALWEEAQALGIDIDDTSHYPEEVHLVLPAHPSERASFIFEDERLSMCLTMFCAARYGTYNICMHEADCECGYRGRKRGMHA